MQEQRPEGGGGRRDRGWGPRGGAVRPGRGRRSRGARPRVDDGGSGARHDGSWVLWWRPVELPVAVVAVRWQPWVGRPWSEQRPEQLPLHQIAFAVGDKGRRSKVSEKLVHLRVQIGMQGGASEFGLP